MEPVSTRFSVKMRRPVLSGAGKLRPYKSMDSNSERNGRGRVGVELVSTRFSVKTRRPVPSGAGKLHRHARADAVVRVELASTRFSRKGAEVHFIGRRQAAPPTQEQTLL